MPKRVMVYERQNEAFHLKVFSDGIAEIIDLTDEEDERESISINANKLPCIKALIDDMIKFQARKKKEKAEAEEKAKKEKAKVEA